MRREPPAPPWLPPGALGTSRPLGAAGPPPKTNLRMSPRREAGEGCSFNKKAAVGVRAQPASNFSSRKHSVGRVLDYPGGSGRWVGRETGSVFSPIPWPQYRTSPGDAALRGGEARETKSLAWAGSACSRTLGSEGSADTGTVKGLRSRKGPRSSEVRSGSRTLPLSLLLQQGRPAAVRMQLRCTTRASARNPRHLQAALVRLSLRG